jgi:DNA polymerase I
LFALFLSAGALAKIGQIDTMITNFLVPLQALADRQGRIHCSLNLNTETGRLSSRKPNLQNQPALEKDQYKIRDAFVAEEGKTFIVADYGQLELRLLAHITQCKVLTAACMLCYVMLCYVMLCYVMLCYVMLCFCRA